MQLGRPTLRSDMGLSTGIYLKRAGTALDEALVAEVSSVVGAPLVSGSSNGESTVFEAVVEGVACVLFETDPSFDPRFASYGIELAILGTRDDDHRVRLAKRIARELEAAGFDVVVEDEVLDIVDHRAPDASTLGRARQGRRPWPGGRLPVRRRT